MLTHWSQLVPNMSNRHPKTLSNTGRREKEDTDITAYWVNNACKVEKRQDHTDIACQRTLFNSLKRQQTDHVTPKRVVEEKKKVKKKLRHTVSLSNG